MPPTPSNYFGEELTRLRGQGGWSRDTLAAALNEDLSFINDLEEGKSEPPTDPEFYLRLQAVPGFSAADIRLLQNAHQADQTINDLALLEGELFAVRTVIMEYVLLIHHEVSHIERQRPYYAPRSRINIPFVAQSISDFLTSLLQSALVGVRGFLTEPVHTILGSLATITTRSPSTVLDVPPDIVEQDKRIPAAYPHTSVSDHARHLVDEGKWQEAKSGRGASIAFQKRQEKEKDRQVSPDQLMTVQDVIDTLGLPASTVWSWFATGRLKERGRVWLAEPGGRGSPLVSKGQAESLKNDRPPRGRPPKRKKKA